MLDIVGCWQRATVPRPDRRIVREPCNIEEAARRREIAMLDRGLVP